MIFMSYLAMMYDPLCQLTGAGVSLQSGLGARRVFEVLDREVQVSDVPDAEAIPVRPRTLTLEAVRFHYDASRPVLKRHDPTRKQRGICRVERSGQKHVAQPPAAFSRSVHRNGCPGRP